MIKPPKVVPTRVSTWSFTVHGPLIGHKCSHVAAVEKSFRSYKRTVRLLANVAGVPDELDPDGVYRVATTIFFTGRARIDAENVRKSIIDALWDRDRRVLEGSYVTRERSNQEMAVVLIERLR